MKLLLQSTTGCVGKVHATHVWTGRDNRWQRSWGKTVIKIFNGNVKI